MSEPAPSPPGESGRATAAERRAFVRYASDLNASCRPAGTAREAGWFARVQDISACGLGLLLRHRFRPGTPLLVEWKRADGTALGVLAARVVHAVAIREGGDLWWRVGCAFDRPLTDDELRALLT
jgi:hypothetical protein